ncbi:hypothetical protein AHAS_Ahas15G0295300 [Arachis hypogaea]
MRKQEEEIEEYSLVCPSFSTYSSHKLAHIADQVTREHYSPPQNDTDLFPNDNHQDHLQNDDTNFEFIAFRKAADGVFFDRFNGPVFPVFNQDLAGTPPECGGGANGDEDGEGDRNSGAEDIRFSMEELLIGEEAENSPEQPRSSVVVVFVGGGRRSGRNSTGNVLRVDSESGTGIAEQMQEEQFDRIFVVVVVAG